MTRYCCVQSVQYIAFVCSLVILNALMHMSVCRVIKNKYSLACLKSMPPEECYERKVHQWLFLIYTCRCILCSAFVFVDY